MVIALGQIGVTLDDVRDAVVREAGRGESRTGRQLPFDAGGEEGVRDRVARIARAPAARRSIRSTSCSACSTWTMRSAPGSCGVRARPRASCASTCHEIAANPSASLRLWRRAVPDRRARRHARGMGVTAERAAERGFRSPRSSTGARSSSGRGDRGGRPSAPVDGDVALARRRERPALEAPRSARAAGARRAAPSGRARTATRSGGGSAACALRRRANDELLRRDRLRDRVVQRSRRTRSRFARRPRLHALAALEAAQVGDERLEHERAVRLQPRARRCAKHRTCSSWVSIAKNVLKTT